MCFRCALESFLWEIAATAGRVYDGWVWSKNKKSKRELLPWLWLWPLSDSTMAFYVYIRQKDDNQFRGITYTRSITESNIFFKKKKQFFLYRIRHRYQSKTCVEHIEQVIDKSLTNSTNSFMNLLYFFVYKGYML